VLCGAVLLVLLITCANLGNLALARGAVRRREMAVRLVHGASTGRLYRQMLTEGLLIAFAGAAAGVLVAYGGLQTMVSLIPRNYIAAQAEISVNARVLMLAFLAALVMGVLISLAPALTILRPNLEEGLKAAGRGLAGEGSGRYFRRVLVICEIALAAVVLVGAGLMARSYNRIAALPLGFNPRGVFVADINLPAFRYQQSAQVSRFFEALVERVNASAGVLSAEVVSQPPMAGWDVDTHDFLIEGRPVETGGPPNADERIVGRRYLQLMGSRLVAGRYFEDQDRAGSLPVAIINQTMARLYWPGRSPIGSRIRLGHGYSRARLLKEDAPSPWLTIIGVVNDARQRPDLVREIRPEIDLPFLQSANRIHNLSLMVRTSNPAGVLTAIRHEVTTLDAQLPVHHFRTMDEIVADGEGPRRLALALLTLFGGLALLLVLVGVYAIIACNVSQRTREVGLRTAIGANPGDICRLIMRQGVQLGLAGVVLGVTLAATLARVMNSLLYEVAALDPLTFGVVSLLLTAVALLASYIPARRAMKVDPMVALRQE
jgi:putative ABC transport system permease protein